MKEYKNSEPEFSQVIQIVETTDPAHADNINMAPKQLLQNTLINQKEITELKADKARFYNFILQQGKIANIYSSIDKSRLPTFMFAVTMVGPNKVLFGSTFNSYPFIGLQPKPDNLSNYDFYLTDVSTDKRFYLIRDNTNIGGSYIFTLLATEDLTIEII